MSLKDIKELITKYENYIDSLEEKYSCVTVPKDAYAAEVSLTDGILQDLYMLEQTSTKVKGCPAVLSNNAETKAYLAKLRKVYMIGHWAHYGVREFPFSGKYADKDKTEPLVYDYDDHNGACDSYYLRNIYNTTTGAVWGWTFNKKDAERIANKLENNK